MAKNQPSSASASSASDKDIDVLQPNHEGVPPRETDAHILPEVEKESPEDVEKKPNAPPAFDPSQFPDGGFQAWLVVLGGWCCLFCSFGWINAIGIFQNYYQANMLRGYSPSTISWIPSLEAFMMFFLGPAIGKAYDNYGPRYILLVGTFFHVFGLMMTSLATEYYQFILAQGICSPIGASMVFYPALSTLPTWFWKWRALAFGIVATGSSIGGIIFPIMVDHLIPKVGYPWTMRISAFLILFLMTIANLTVRSRLPPRPQPFNIKDFIKPFGEVTYVLLTLGSFLAFMGMFLPINYIIVQARAQGMSQHLASYLVPILNAWSIFGRTIPGAVGDRLGRFNVLIFMCYFTAIFVLALWFRAKKNAAIIAFASVYGFGSGAFVSLAPACIAQISDVTKIGVRTGAMFSVISIAALISNPIGGAILDDWTGRFGGLKIFCGVMWMAGSTSILLSRVTQAGFKLNVKV